MTVPHLSFVPMSHTFTPSTPAPTRFRIEWDADLVCYVVRCGEIRVVPTQPRAPELRTDGAERASAVCVVLNRIYAK